MSTRQWSRENLPMAIACAATAPCRVQAVKWDEGCEEYAPTIFLAVYDAGAFDRAAFREAGIDCPDAISRAVTKRQAEYFHGRLCARAALAHANAGLHQIPAGAMRAPVWPPDYAGSITHSRTLAAAVVAHAAQCRGIGIDIEDVSSGAALEALRKTVVSTAELAYLDAIAAEIGIDVLLTLIFSAKESFFKAVFSTVNRYIDFDALEIRSIDFGKRRAVFVVQENLCPQFMAGDTCSIAFELIGKETVFTLWAWQAASL